VFALFGARPVRAADLPQASTPTLAITALHLDVQVQARVEEGHVLFQQDLRWSLPDGVGRVALDGVTLPLLFPSVGEPPVAVDRGIIPPTTQDVEIEAEGGVKVTRKQESLLLQGGVSAGKTEFVRVRFALPIRAGSQTLALSGHAAGRTWLTMAMVASPPVRITLATDRPGRLSRFEEGRERLVGASLAQALGPAEVARVTMSDLPTPARQPGRALAWFAGAIALTGLASLLARRSGKSAEQQT
jgi:hypothetical protein